MYGTAVQAILDHKNLTGLKVGLGRSNSAKKWPKFGFGASRGLQMGEGPLKKDPKWSPHLPLNNLSPFEEDFVGRGFAGDDFVFVFFFIFVFVFVFVFVFFPVFVFVRDEEDYVSRGFGGDD